MRVHIVDPSAYTPPYDDALCQALARAGAEVELYTSRYTYARLPPARGYARHERFYRRSHGRASGRPRSPAMRVLKLAEHGPDMLRYRQIARRADIVHFQWLPVQPLDAHLLPRRAPSGPCLVLTAHDVLPREPLPGQRAAQARLYRRFDAIVVHSDHGRDRLTGDLGVDARRVHVIPHGVLPLAAGALPAAAGAPPSTVAAHPPGALAGGAGALPPELRDAPGPVVLFFGLLRPYKGLDVLLDAWRRLDRSGAGRAGGAPGGEPRLWIAGMPRMDTAPIRAGAPESVRFLERFLGDHEIAGLLARASLVVLPYREIDASGAAFTALGAGVPLLLSDAGSFPELAATGAARCVPAGDAAALATALAELLGEGAALDGMAAAAARAGAPGGPFGWPGIAARTLALYRALLGERPSRKHEPVAA